MVSSFALGSRVVLSGLSKAPQYNGCIAIVVSDLLPGGRQTVSLMDTQYENKTISVKPGNLNYEPIKIETFSVKQLKAVLKGTDQEHIPGSEVGDLRNQVSGMDADLVAQIFAKINLSSSSSPTLTSQELYTFADGKCAHCFCTPEAYQVHYHQISILFQEAVEKGLSRDLMLAFWEKHSNLVDNSTVAVAFAMTADWVLKHDYKMARIAARTVILMDSIRAAGQDSESMRKCAQEAKKLVSDRGLICLLKKKIPCPCLNEASREARENLPKTGHCGAPGCGMILPKTELMKCSGCQVSEYCSRDCQKSHWEEHKKLCMLVANGNADLIIAKTAGKKK
jgi:hypothetical protein